VRNVFRKGSCIVILPVREEGYCRLFKPFNSPAIALSTNEQLSSREEGEEMAELPFFSTYEKAGFFPSLRNRRDTFSFSLN